MCIFYELMHYIKYLREQNLYSIDILITIDFAKETELLMIFKLYANDMRDVITRKIFYFFMGKLKKGFMFSKFKNKVCTCSVL